MIQSSHVCSEEYFHLLSRYITHQAPGYAFWLGYTTEYEVTNPHQAIHSCNVIIAFLSIQTYKMVTERGPGEERLSLGVKDSGNCKCYHSWTLITLLVMALTWISEYMHKIKITCCTKIIVVSLSQSNLSYNHIYVGRWHTKLNLIHKWTDKLDSVHVG